MSDITQAKTYEEILSEMTEDFQSQSGFYPDNASDIGIRLKVLASQIFSLNYKLNWIWKQSSPLTATGEFLDRHAFEKGIERKHGRKATGEVTFYLEEPVSSDIDIEQGTVVATNTLASAKRFETTEAVTIRAGQTEVSAAALALEIGLESNVCAGSVKVIEDGRNYLFVKNDEAFTSGTQPESDDKLRSRIINSYQTPAMSSSAAYYKNLALSDEEVISAGVVPLANGVGTVKVAIATSEPYPSNEVILRVGALLRSQKEFGIDVSVSAPNFLSLDVMGDLSVKEGYSANETGEECENIIKKYIQSLGVGDAFIKADVYKQIMEVEGVRNINLYAPFDDKFVSADTLIKEGRLVLNIISR